MSDVARTMPLGRKLSYVDGRRLKKAVMAAAEHVEKAQDQLNRINVFPVADRDTGSNMAQTLRGMTEALRNADGADLGEMSVLMADAALMSATGNSGVILAQFFQGMARGFAGHKRAGPEEFSRSMGQAASAAAEAVGSPCDGTILTVMRDWANSLDRARSETISLVELLESSLPEAQASLRKTTTLLRVLAAAKVVDAGAQGFVCMLEGVLRLVETGELGWAETLPVHEAMPEADEDDKTFRYCTECIVRGQDIDLARVRAMADSFGNSVVVAGSNLRVRIHVHTNDPALVFAGAAAFGAVSGPKHEDMWAQCTVSRKPIAVITDSSCDLPADYIARHGILMVPLKVIFGQTEYLDRVTITSDDIYDMMDKSEVLPRTSQATPLAFLETFERASREYREAIAIIVTSAGTGTFQSALIAAQKQTAMKIEVVDSRTCSAALGFLVETAVDAINEGLSLAEVRKRVEESRSVTRIFFSVSSLNHLVRTGRVSPTSRFIGRLLRLAPILSFSREGRIVSVGKSRPGKAGWTKLVETAIQECTRLSNPRFHVCHSAEEQGARFIADALARHLHILPPEILRISPAMGTMVGPGVCVVAVTGTPQK